jgi:urease accessory protein
LPRDLLPEPGAAHGGRRGRALRVGVGGPVGSGKTTLVAGLCRTLRDELSLAVVADDVNTREDAEFLLRQGALEPERVVAVETGCSPHTAIRDDISANLEAAEQLEAAFPELDVLLIESGGGDLTATFSKGLIDRQIFVLDVAAGDGAPRRGGPGLVGADLLVVNKTDLAPLVRADLDTMRRDAAAGRGERPTLFTSLAEHPGAPAVADWIRQLMAQRRLTAGTGAGAAHR